MIENYSKQTKSQAELARTRHARRFSTQTQGVWHLSGIMPAMSLLTTQRPIHDDDDITCQGCRLRECTTWGGKCPAIAALDSAAAMNRWCCIADVEQFQSSKSTTTCSLRVALAPLGCPKFTRTFTQNVHALMHTNTSVCKHVSNVLHLGQHTDTHAHRHTRTFHTGTVDMRRVDTRIYGRSLSGYTYRERTNE